MPETIFQPNWDDILKQCRNKMIDKYEEYGNSWVGDMRRDFWEPRLLGEVDEALEGKKPEEVMKELVDIINVCAMYYTNIKNKYFGGETNGRRS